MRRQSNLFQLKEQGENPETTTNETEINSLPDKEFKVLVIRILSELRKRRNEHSENFNKEVVSMKKDESELKNTITNEKHTRRK